MIIDYRSPSGVLLPPVKRRIFFILQPQISAEKNMSRRLIVVLFAVCVCAFGCQDKQAEPEPVLPEAPAAPVAVPEPEANAEAVAQPEAAAVPEVKEVVDPADLCGDVRRPSGKDSRDYECRDGLWLCNDNNGCVCGDGALCYGVCTDGKCLQAPADPKRDVYCLDGNCACGDGFCAKNAICRAGMCICRTAETDKGCGNEIVSGDFGEFSCHSVKVENRREVLFMCERDEGCRLRDGRHYMKYGVVSANPEVMEGMVGCFYHLDGDEDTTRVTLCPEGDCVIPWTVEQRPAEVAEAAEGVVADGGNQEAAAAKPEPGDQAATGEAGAVPNEPAMIDVNLCKVFERPTNGYVSFWDDVYEEAKVTLPESDKPTFADTEGRKVFVPIAAFDAAICAGGTRYCHGVGQKPLAAPAEPKGYACLPVNSMPVMQDAKKKPKGKGKDAKTAEVVAVESPLLDSALDVKKAWKCTGESCACGGKACAQGGLCINERCYCGEYPLEEGYACIDDVARCEHDTCQCGKSECERGEACDGKGCLCGNDKAPGKNYLCKSAEWVCPTHDGCNCGNSLCFDNMVCKDGTCLCDGKPAPDENYRCEERPEGLTWVCHADVHCRCYSNFIAKGDVCRPVTCGEHEVLKGSGCFCGDSAALGSPWRCAKNQDKYENICASTEGCTCGKELCPWGSVCRSGNCVDRIKGEAIPEGILYKMTRGYALCIQEEGCACGKGTCREGMYCVAGECYENPVYRIIGGKQVFFDIRDVREVRDEYDIANDPAPMTPNYNRVWDEVLSSSDYCGGIAMPDDPLRYVCRYETWIAGACGKDAGTVSYRALGWICAADTCPCGTGQCSKNEMCLNGYCMPGVTAEE